jgi:hypothetical protein
MCKIRIPFPNFVFDLKSDSGKILGDGVVGERLKLFW